MAADKETIGVVGVGWVGLVTATCFAELGHPVIALDILEEKIEALRRGEAPMHEPGLDELLAGNAERLTFTTSMDEVLAGARLLFCCVDTPPTYSGDADLSRVRAVVEKLPDGGEHALVMKSTVPSGTGAAIKRDKPDLAYVSCPEFLKEGSAVQDFMHPDRVVVGADAGSEWAADAVEEIYRPLDGEMVRTDVASAEMIKLASNAFLATKISFINEIANVCEQTGADVLEVARGMGLDERIGKSFLNAGIGYGGSCFSRNETALVRLHGRIRLVTFEQLWDLVGGDDAAIDGEAIEPAGLETWSWVPGEGEPEWMSVSVLTKRHYEGEMVDIRTKMGRRLSVTADHPLIVGDGTDADVLTHVLAGEVATTDWLPLAAGAADGSEPLVYSLMSAVEDGHVPLEDVIIRPAQSAVETLAAMGPSERRQVLTHPRGHAQRMGDIKRTGAMRLAEAWRAGIDAHEASMATATNGTYVPATLRIDEAFWRVVGLYIAEGCVSTDIGRGGARRQRILWSFHPRLEDHLVDEVVEFWGAQGIKTTPRRAATSHRVEISSRLLAAWWLKTLGLGRDSYGQRLPDLIWEQSADRKRALLSGLWEGDGSWSLVNGGPSVTLDFGTCSDELAEGVVRLLGDLGIICSWRRAWTPKSTTLTHWLSVTGADQIERAIFLVPEADRERVLDSISRQAKRIAPTGSRRFGDSLPFVRVTAVERRVASEPVYSLKVPFSHTVVTSGGLVSAQCFPKDVSALEQLAGNTGYHFQLLNAVIEVNELQKRRVVAKLEKHLGSLADRKIALLGLAFKPNTDDMREASSLVLSARLQGEGATVTAFDPVAERAASGLLPDVEMSESVERAFAGADAAVLVTEWPQFAELDWAALAGTMANPLIVDGRNFLDAEKLRAAGFAYEGIGRPSEGS